MSDLLTVRAPVEGFTGVVVGVAFAEGVGKVAKTDARARAYFARQGYTVGADEAVAAVSVVEQAPAEPSATPAEGAAPAPTPGALERPNARATKAEWLQYAIAEGLDPDEAAEMKRDDLAALFDQED